MAQCIQCGGEGKTTLYRFGNTRDAEGTGAGCIYSSFNACLEDNNPRNISVSPDCLVFVNDNGNDLKIPAIGWNKIFYKNENKLNNFEDLIDNNFYFTHSYYVEPEDKNIIHSEVDYGGFRYCSSVRFKNLLATQFHPEKSGITGLNLLRNFLIDSLNYEKNH